ncbi:MAG TPA: hypothetical protein PK445_03255 [Methanolinea sp.]|nr:hypothetical protein [Methanolinea sp.]HRU80325.1 hypothetical protein [Methanolinea sp.]
MFIIHVKFTVVWLRMVVPSFAYFTICTCVVAAIVGAIMHTAMNRITATSNDFL